MFYFLLGGLRAGTHSGPNLWQSVFDYIEKHNARAPVFFNFMYTPDTDQPVSNYMLIYCFVF